MFNQLEQSVPNTFEQAKVNSDNIKEFKLNAAKAINRSNPMLSPLAPWHIALARRTFVNLVTAPIVFQENFWKTWAEVMYPEPKQNIPL